MAETLIKDQYSAEAQSNILSRAHEVLRHSRVEKKGAGEQENERGAGRVKKSAIKSRKSSLIGAKGQLDRAERKREGDIASGYRSHIYIYIYIYLAPARG